MGCGRSTQAENKVTDTSPISPVEDVKPVDEPPSILTATPRSLQSLSVQPLAGQSIPRVITGPFVTLRYTAEVQLALPQTFDKFISAANHFSSDENSRNTQLVWESSNGAVNAVTDQESYNVMKAAAGSSDGHIVIVRRTEKPPKDTETYTPISPALAQFTRLRNMVPINFKRDTYIADYNYSDTKISPVFVKLYNNVPQAEMDRIIQGWLLGKRFTTDGEENFIDIYFENEFTLIVTEFYARSLATDIVERGGQTAEPRYYTQNELCALTKTIVGVFSKPAREGIHHQAIRPSCLFPNEDYSALSVGDFELTQRINQPSIDIGKLGDETIWQSPKKRQGIVKAEKSINEDLEKGDVWSIGVVLLTAALCKEPEVSLLDSSAITEALNKIQERYGAKLSHLLSQILQMDEEKRPTFAELQQLAEKLDVN